MATDKIQHHKVSFENVNTTTFTSQREESARRAPSSGFTDSLTLASSQGHVIGLPKTPLLPPPTATSSSTDPWQDLAQAMSDVFQTQGQAESDQVKDLNLYQQMDQQMSKAVLQQTNLAMADQKTYLQYAADVTAEEQELASESTFAKDISYAMYAVMGAAALFSGGAALVGLIEECSVGAAMAAAGDAGAAGLGEGASAALDDMAAGVDMDAGAPENPNPPDETPPDLDGGLKDATGPRAPGSGSGPAVDGTEPRSGGVAKPDNSLKAWMEWLIHKAIAASGSAVCAVPQFMEWRTKNNIADSLQQASDAQTATAEPMALTQQYNMFFTYYQVAAQRKSDLVSTMTDQLCNIIKLEGSLMQNEQQMASTLGNVIV